MVLTGCRWVHTVGMRFALDVAYVDEKGIVVKTVHMRRHRVGAPVCARWNGDRSASRPAFGRWGLRVGDVVEVRGDRHPRARVDADRQPRRPLATRRPRRCSRPH